MMLIVWWGRQTLNRQLLIRYKMAVPKPLPLPGVSFPVFHAVKQTLSFVIKPLVQSSL